MSNPTIQLQVGCLVANSSVAYLRRRIICVAVCAAMLAPLGGYAQSNSTEKEKESAAQLSANSSVKYMEMDGGVAPGATSHAVDDQLPIAGLGIVILAALGFTRWMRNGPIEELEARGLSRKTTGRIYLGKRGFN